MVEVLDGVLLDALSDDEDELLSLLEPELEPSPEPEADSEVEDERFDDDVDERLSVL
ncbi:MAG: hypothetical protein ACRDYW_11875 [Acidimicrobiales bacterium]